MRFLVDTNVVSELRKGDAANARVRAWCDSVRDENLYLSVLVIGEIRRGIENIRRRDLASAFALEAWLSRLVAAHGDRILPVTTEIAETWGRFGVPNPLPVVDSVLAATAHVHGLTVATRDTRHIARTGVPTFNPFEGGTAD